MYLTGFPARVSAVPHVICALKAFFVLGGFFCWIWGFFSLQHHLQAFVSTYLSAPQTLGLNLLLSSPLWSPICDDSDLEPNPMLSLRNCSTYLFNSSEIIWIQHVLPSLLSRPHDFHFSLASSSFLVPLIVCYSFSFFWVSLPQTVTQSDTFRCMVEVTGMLILLSEVPLKKCIL